MAEIERRKTPRSTRLTQYANDPVAFVEEELLGSLWSKQTLRGLLRAPGRAERSNGLRRASLANRPPRNPCDARFDVSEAIIAGYGPRKRSPSASRRR